MNIMDKESVLTRGAIIWIFILLSFFAHSLFLMLNNFPPSDNNDGEKKYSSLEITLQPSAPTQAESVTSPLNREKPSLAQITKQSRQDKVAASDTISPTPIKQSRVEPSTAIQQANDAMVTSREFSGLQIRSDAIAWLRQQANLAGFTDPASLHQIVAYGSSHVLGSPALSAYHDNDGRINVVVNSAYGPVCASIRQADPLHSFDQSVWMINTVCRG